MASNLSSTSSVPTNPTNNVLPPTTTQVFAGTTIVNSPTLSDVTAETENQSSFLAQLQLAIKNNSTWAAFQTAMAALPPTP